MKCLIVDDNTAIRKTLEQYLKGIYDCDLVDNGHNAIKAVAESIKSNQPYDLMTLDIEMPGIDGHETLRLIRRTEADLDVSEADRVSVIMTTGCDDSENIAEAGKAGCQNYLVKPFTKNALLDEVEKINDAKPQTKSTGSKLKGLFSRT